MGTRKGRGQRFRGRHTLHESECLKPQQVTLEGVVPLETTLVSPQHFEKDGQWALCWGISGATLVCRGTNSTLQLGILQKIPLTCSE